MSFNFPAGPTVGQVFGAYTWDGEKWKVSAAGTGIYSLVVSDTPPVGAPANTLWWESDTGFLYLRYADANSSQWVVVSSGYSEITQKNYIVNGAMLVSQENAATAGSINTFYPVDGFYASLVNGGVQSIQQVASITHGGSPNRIRYTCVTADAAVAAGDYAALVQNIEGIRIADLFFGLGSAKTITLRFGVRAPAGIYCVGLRNWAATRSYIAEYTITPAEANLDKVVSLTIPGCTDGVWPIDANASLVVVWALMAGTTFQQTAGSWQVAASSKFASANQSNFMSTNGNIFELFDVGLYVGMAAPVYVAPKYEDELLTCMRYYERGGSNMNYRSGGTFQAGIVQAIDTIRYLVPKRVAATLSFAGWQYYNTTDSFIAVSPSMYAGTIDQFQVNGAAMTNYKAWAAGGNWFANARV